MPNCEVKLMNNDGTTEVAQGQRGEMWVRTPSLMKGYWRKPDATRETVTADGWMKTGDIAFQDEHGKFSIVDRKKASSLAT
jgi:4-coumarate--CoA ligase